MYLGLLNVPAHTLFPYNTKYFTYFILYSCSECFCYKMIRFLEKNNFPFKTNLNCLLVRCSYFKHIDASNIIQFQPRFTNIHLSLSYSIKRTPEFTQSKIYNKFSRHYQSIRFDIDTLIRRNMYVCFACYIIRNKHNSMKK